MISFVGAGPGADDLITVRGARRLAAADVVVWASSLVPASLLSRCREGIEVHDSKAMTLEDVLGVYARHPGESIVRLHSGDPSLFGAIGEQIDWCVAHSRDFEIVPGVTSASAAAAALGRELTLPGVSQSVVMTRLAGRTAASMPPGDGVAALAAHGATMAVFLSGARPDELQGALLGTGSGFTAETPAAIVERVSWPDERIVRTTAGRLAEDMRALGATLTVLVVVGDVLAARAPAGRSHLYDPSFGHTFRLPSRRGSTAGRPSRRAQR